jgi:hypothetical protein
MWAEAWAKKWGVTNEALHDLYQLLGLEGAHDLGPMGTEAGAQSIVRLEASRKGCRLWRNNVGAFVLPQGRFIRFGLANESPRINQVIKSADLIGIRPVAVMPCHVGTTIGQFLSREVKAPGWRYVGGAREEAQLRWAELVLSLGGDACFATGEGTI